METKAVMTQFFSCYIKLCARAATSTVESESVIADHSQDLVSCTKDFLGAEYQAPLLSLGMSTDYTRDLLSAHVKSLATFSSNIYAGEQELPLPLSSVKMLLLSILKPLIYIYQELLGSRAGTYPAPSPSV